MIASIALKCPLKIIHQQEAKMFVSIRKYEKVVSIDEVKRRAEQEFIPLLKQNAGFRNYYLVGAYSDAGDILTAISIFDSWEAALASNDIAKKFVKDRLADMLPEPAQSVGGEVILSA
jgi:hypothetical protein